VITWTVVSIIVATRGNEDHLVGTELVGFEGEDNLTFDPRSAALVLGFLGVIRPSVSSALSSSVSRSLEDRMVCIPLPSSVCRTLRCLIALIARTTIVVVIPMPESTTIAMRRAYSMERDNSE